MVCRGMDTRACKGVLKDSVRSEKGACVQWFSPLKKLTGHPTGNLQVALQVRF